LSFTPTASAQTRTIRVANYNIEDDISGATTPLPGLIAPPSNTNDFQAGGVLEGIGEENVGNDPAQPLDILALEETTSNPLTIAPIVNGLNTFYDAPGMYAMSPYQATESGDDAADGNGPNALVYNTTTVQLLASVPVDPPGGTSQLGSSSGEYREVMRYEFAPAGVTATANNEFYVYVSHYKSGTTAADATDRNGEAQIIRNDEANNLPATARVLYVGDYNVDTSGEAMYQTLLATNAPNGGQQGEGIDPLNPTNNPDSDWETTTTATNILVMLTEEDYELRYRDDLQVCTTNVYYGTAGGLALVPGTYHAFANNATTAYGDSVNDGTDTALIHDLVTNGPVFISASQLYLDLTDASDHLPVVADYTIPLPAPAPVANFTASPTNGVVLLPVAFSNLSTNATNYLWNFGDGNTSTDTNPVDIYTNAGTYSVTLTAAGPGGTNALTLTNYIVTVNPPPLQLENFVPSANGGFEFTASNSDGTFITSNQESQIAIFATTNLALNFTNWTPLTNVIQLTNGTLQINDTNSVFYPQRFYRAVEAP
jgi:PKD repeat protein